MIIEKMSWSIRLRRKSISKLLRPLNGIAAKDNRCLLDMARAVIFIKGLDLFV
jgi:hypothetical protein